MTLKDIKEMIEKEIEENPELADFIVTDISYSKRNGDIKILYFDINNEEQNDYATISLQ